MAHVSVSLYDNIYFSTLIFGRLRVQFGQDGLIFSGERPGWGWLGAAEWWWMSVALRAEIGVRFLLGSKGAGELELQL